jgi:glycosyltransferase involved in cell wall biosynthesis
MKAIKNTASVSVVIPCFNSEKTIRRALQSVLDQSLQVKEIICIDDASTDMTKEILSELASTITQVEIKIIFNTVNFGPSNSRNSGWDIATGDFIAFLDSDDLWHPQKIQIQYSWMKENPNIFLSGHETFMFDSISKKQNPFWLENSLSIIYPFLAEKKISKWLI